MLGALPLLALILILLLVATSYWLFFASLIAFGALLGFLDMAMNAEASAIEHDLRRPIFTTFHGSVSIAIAFFAIVSSFLSAIAGTFATSMLGVAVLGLAWLMVSLLVGSVSGAVIRRAPCPVLVVRAPDDAPGRDSAAV